MAVLQRLLANLLPEGLYLLLERVDVAGQEVVMLLFGRNIRTQLFELLVDPQAFFDFEFEVGLQHDATLVPFLLVSGVVVEVQ